MSSEHAILIDIDPVPTRAPAPMRTLFQALANPAPLRIAGHLQNPEVFSRRHLVNTEIRGLTIKVSESPIILPPLYAHMAEAVAIMARNVADNGRLDYTTTRARLFHSYKYLMKGETNFFRGIHIDCGDITTAISSDIPARDIGIVSDIPCLTTQFYTAPILLDPAQVSILDGERENEIQNRLFGAISDRCEGLAPYRPDAYEVVIMNEATAHSARPNPGQVDYRRTILTVIFERDTGHNTSNNAFLFNYLQGQDPHLIDPMPYQLSN